MKPETIKAIFTNLIFVIGIILTVFGFVRGVSTTAKIAVFNEYPLESYEESRCESYLNVARPVGTNVYYNEDNQAQYDNCVKDLAQRRKFKLVDDVTQTVSLLTSGLVLAYIFRRFIFK